MSRCGKSEETSNWRADASAGAARMAGLIGGGKPLACRVCSRIRSVRYFRF
jgi:hypothetical protein